MKTEMRLAGVLGSVAFLVVAAGGLYATLDPIHSMVYGVLGAMAVAVIGHRMGHIVSHPENKKRPHQPKVQHQAAISNQDPLALKPLTGDETFLDDL